MKIESHYETSIKDMVSVVMPSNNCEKYVEETIHSVLAQTYKNWELLFVDDNSQDGTLNIVKALATRDVRIKIFENKKHCGAAVSRNIALREAKGRWIAFLDSDDVWESQKLEKQVAFMEQYGYAFTYTNYQEIDQFSNNRGIFISGPKHITKWGMYAFCWPGCLTVMWDAKKIGKVQIADIKKNNDYALWLKVAQKVDCYLLDECLAKYRVRIGSISNHSYLYLVKWHFKLFHEAEKMNIIQSLLMTGINIFFGIMKKLIYVKRKK